MSSDRLPLVSVIIPTYNRREYVRLAIESALAQTYTDFEIIVIDDGSTDGTGEALRAYDGRIHYIFKANEGNAAAARNYGMSIARGEYIALLDSDDLWLPDKLLRQMETMLDDSDLGLVSGHVGVIDATGTVIDPGPKHPWQIESVVLPSDIVLRSPLHASTLLVRRRFMDADLPFDPRFRICEDWHLCLQVASQARVGFVPDVVALLRSHGGMSTTLDVDGATVDERLTHRLQVLEETLPRLPIPESQRTAIKAQAVAEELSLAAMGNYYNELFDLAEDQVRQMVALDADRWGSGERFAELLRTYAVVGARSKGYAAASAFAERVSLSLTRIAPRFTRLRSRTLAHVHIELGFLAYQRSDRWRTIYHLCRGVMMDPSWSQNRGILSVLGRSSVGERLFSAPKRACRRSR